MSEIERIRSMAAEGTITRDEADKLIALLRDIDDTEAQVDAVASAARAGEGSAVGEPGSPPDMSRARTDTTAVDPAQRRTSVAAADQPAPATDPSTAGSSGAGATRATRTTTESSRAGSSTSPGLGLHTPAGFRWFEIATLAGDIDVTLDASLDAPVVDGPKGVSVRQTADGYALDLDRGGSFLDRLMAGELNRDIDVRLPENMGVELRMKAGDVTLKGVPYLRGHILAGDVTARGLRGVDLRMSAGDLDLWLAPTAGEHRLVMTAGDIHVRLDPASSVRVEGRVNIGDASVPAGFEVERRGIGESFSGTIGSGESRLEISQSTGDTTVSIDRG